VVLKSKERVYGAFNESKEGSTSNTDINIIGLIVYAKTGTNAENSRMESGSVDLSTGYAMFNWNDLNTAGLIDGDNNPTFNSNVDEMEFMGYTFKMTGQELVGPFEDRFALVKVHFKRHMNDR
jgi:hypothetical protein